MTKKEYEALLEVREIVRTKHTTGANHRKELDRYCLVGAVNKVTNIPQEYDSEMGKNRNNLLRRRDWQTRNTLLELIAEKCASSSIEYFNDTHTTQDVLDFLDLLIEVNEPENMEIGPEKPAIIVEPAEPIPGVKEQPAEPLPAPDPVAPEREKVPA